MAVSVGGFTKYYNEIIKSTNTLRSQEAKNLTIQSQKIKALIDHIEKGEIGAAVTALGNFSNTAKFIDYFPTNILRMHPEEIPVIPQKKVGEKFDSLSNMFKNFEILSYFGYNEYTQWNARIVMKHADPKKNFGFEFDFGVFSFYFKVKNDGKPDVIIKPSGTDNKILESGSFHPHIRTDGRACIGTYEKDIKADIAKLDIFSIIQNITLIMEQYNPTSIFSEDIHAWIGQKCPVCFGCIGPNDKQARCSKQMVMMHKDCAKQIGDNYYNPVLIKQCASCDAETSDWVFINNSIICKDCV